MLQTIRQKPIEAAALVTSIVALLVSIASFVVSRDAQKQASTEFRQARQLVLTGEFETLNKGVTCPSIKVKPISSDFRFQGGEAMIPDQFYKNIIPIANNGEFLHMGDVCIDLQRVISDKVKWKKDIAQIGTPHMPLMIKSFYAVKGEAYTDISLYLLDTNIVVTDKEYEPPHITFDGLSFLQRFPNNEPMNLKLLNELVNSPTGFEVKPRAP